MADAGVTAVLSKLREVASAEATALLMVDDQIRELRRRLVYLQALVRGADQQRRGRASELLLLWARETREVAFEVEDAVDEFHLKVETFQVKLKWAHPWYHSALKLLNGIAMQIMARHGLSREITKINGRIKEIGKIKETYKIESSSSEIWSASSVDAAHVDWDIEADNAIQLRETEFETLKGYILEKQSGVGHRAVISIVGPSGAGKTTLARKLYDDRGVREHLKVHAWISLPARIRFDKYLEMMYKQVSRQVPAESRNAAGTSDDVQYKLEQLLKQHEYLVVLDGLVDMSDWNSLVRLLPDDNPKSRILVTTQLNVKEIRASVEQIAPVVLQPLQLGSTGTNIDKLLFPRGFGSGFFSRERFGSGLNGVGDPISLRSQYSKSALEISAGLPLAIVVLCGLLRTKVSRTEWDQVFQQLQTTPTGQPAVRCVWALAFEDLPHHLKACFLYFAMASDNILLGPERLVRLWVAEGFVTPKKGRTLEEVGLGYLKELISRGLVQAVKDGRGGIKFVAVHSLLHAFAESEAQESGFFEMHHHANILNPHSARRLALHNYLDSYVDIPNHFPKLRSLFCDFFEEDQRQGGEHQHGWAEWFLRACGGSISDSRATRLHDLSFIRGSRFLRVIDLYGLVLAKVPNEIGGIIHLRYLGIRNCKLAALPSSISKLDNLQTLDVRGTRVQEVTDEFWEIQGLRHVLAAADGLRLSTCPGTRLRHLQTLVGAVPAGNAWRATVRSCPLDSMIYLRSLAMSLISEQHVPALSRALQKMEFLVSLSLSGDLLPSGVFTSRCSRRLEVLVLDGRLNSDLGDGPFFLPSLGMLSMRESGVEQNFINKVAKLPTLIEMELLDGSYIGPHLVFPADGFQSLTKLKLLNLAKLELVVLAPKSTLLTTFGGCPALKLEPEFEDALPYFWQPILPKFGDLKDMGASDLTKDYRTIRCDPREDGMLLRRPPRYGASDLTEDYTTVRCDSREDEMLVRRPPRYGASDLTEDYTTVRCDPREDEMLVRRPPRYGASDLTEDYTTVRCDPREDEMLVRRPPRYGASDLTEDYTTVRCDPREDEMLVRRPPRYGASDLTEDREDEMLVRRPPRYGASDLTEDYTTVRCDPREDEMLVRRPPRYGASDLTEDYTTVRCDPREDEMLVRRPPRYGASDLTEDYTTVRCDPREDEMLVRRPPRYGASDLTEDREDEMLVRRPPRYGASDLTEDYTTVRCDPREDEMLVRRPPRYGASDLTEDYTTVRCDPREDEMLVRRPPRYGASDLTEDREDEMLVRRPPRYGASDLTEDYTTVRCDPREDEMLVRRPPRYGASDLTEDYTTVRCDPREDEMLVRRPPRYGASDLTEDREDEMLVRRPPRYGASDLTEDYTTVRCDPREDEMLVRRPPRYGASDLTEDYTTVRCDPREDEMLVRRPPRYGASDLTEDREDEMLVRRPPRYGASDLTEDYTTVRCDPIEDGMLVRLAMED